MHIRHLVCTGNFAGVERYVATTSLELARRGHHVEVYGGDAATMTAVLASSPVRFVDAPGPGTALRASLRGSRPDLVHAHMTAADVVAIATRPVHRAPVVSTLHFARPRGHDRFTEKVYALVPRLVHRQIAISEFVATRVGGAPTVLHNGVPDPRPTVGPTDAHRDPVVLIAQRLESEKATGVALEAFATSGLADRGWELHVAGAGSERTSLETTAERLGIAPATHFLGRVTDLDTRMARAALFLAPAPAEPFGLSVVEAMASGLPVIAADGGAHRETVGSATPDSLFPPGDTGAAADLLARVAAEPSTRADLAVRGRRRYEETFTIDAHVDALETLYGTLGVGTSRP